MKWLGLFNKKRNKEDDSPSDEEEEEQVNKRRVHIKDKAIGKPSLSQWFEARRSRTYIDTQNTTTTESLQVCKAGLTTLINRTYIVIKHLGTGTYGQVKLAFNLKDKKLYAIKTCRKSQLGCPSLNTRRGVGARSGPMRLRRTLLGGGNHHAAAALAVEKTAGGFTSIVPQSSDPVQGAFSPQPSLSSLSSGCMTSAYSMPLPFPSSQSSCKSTSSTGATEIQQQQQQQQAMRAAAAAGRQASSHGLSDMSAVVSALAQQRAPGMSGVNDTFDQLKAEEFVREIAIMKRLAHPNIVKLVEVIDDPASDNLLLVMEYVEGSTLQPRKLSATCWATEPEAEVWRRVRDVLQGLDYLHYHEVVHGDLKPANLMMDANTHKVKIVDFGSAVLNNSRGRGQPCRLTSGMMGPGTMSCTPAFRSPESLQPGYHLSFELDMWALGVTLYLWVFGGLPFNGAAPFMVYENIRKQELRIPEETAVSNSLLTFIRALLEKDPAKRLDVASAMQHPWVTGGSSAPLESFGASERHSGYGQAGGGSDSSGGEAAAEGCQDMLLEGRGDVEDLVMSEQQPGPGPGPAPRHEEAAEQQQWSARPSGRLPMQCMSLPSTAAARRRPLRQWSTSMKHSSNSSGKQQSRQGSLLAVPEVWERFEQDAVASGSGSGHGVEGSTQPRPSPFVAQAPLPSYGALRPRAAGTSQQQQQQDSSGQVDGSGRKKVLGIKRASSRSLIMRSLSQEELDQAVCSGGGVEAIGRVFEEVRFAPKDKIITAGDPLMHVYLIAQGEVELFHEVPAGMEDQARHLLGSELCFPIISGLENEAGRLEEGDGEEDEATADFLVANQQEISESLHSLFKDSPAGFPYSVSGPNSSTSPANTRGMPRAHPAPRPSTSGISAMRDASDESARHDSGLHSGAASGSSRGPGPLPPSRLVLGVRGPGDILGLVRLEPLRPNEPQPTWQANVRANSDVLALRAEVQALQQLAAQHPELASAVRNIAVQQETDLKVAQALRQLRMSSMGPGQQARGQAESSEGAIAAASTEAAVGLDGRQVQHFQTL